jgi:hypothetical protein
MRRTAICTSAALALSLIATQGFGATIIGDGKDAFVRDNTSGGDGTGDLVLNQGSNTFDAGFWANDNRRAGVFVFQLPTRSPGQVVDTANFSVQEFSRDAAVDFDIDLWGLRVSDPSDGDTTDDEVLTTDYGVGTSPAGPSGQELIEESFIDNDVDGDSQRHDTDAAGESNLVTFLNNNYVDNGLLFLRATPDSTLPDGDTRNYTFAAGDRSSGQPELDVTLVPEPASASLALVGLGSLVMVSGRRRRQ